MGNCLARVPKGQHDVVAAAIPTVSSQSDRPTAGAHWRRVSASLPERFAKLAAVLDAAEDDVLGFMDFPVAHQAKLQSTNPLERPNEEIKRRTDPSGSSRKKPASSGSSAPRCSSRTTTGPRPGAT
jgi:putative transposase